METVFNEIQHSVKNWWTSLLLGIVYIIVALWLMFSPVSSYIALCEEMQKRLRHLHRQQMIRLFYFLGKNIREIFLVNHQSLFYNRNHS